jgi:hypothetical protein
MEAPEVAQQVQPVETHVDGSDPSVSHAQAQATDNLTAHPTPFTGLNGNGHDFVPGPNGNGHEYVQGPNGYETSFDFHRFCAEGKLEEVRATLSRGVELEMLGELGWGRRTGLLASRTSY